MPAEEAISQDEISNDNNSTGETKTTCPSNEIGPIPDEKDEMKTEKNDPPKSTSSKMFLNASDWFMRSYLSYTAP